MQNLLDQPSDAGVQAGIVIGMSGPNQEDFALVRLQPVAEVRQGRVITRAA
jgi:hypothetical protein